MRGALGPRVAPLSLRPPWAAKGRRAAPARVLEEGSGHSGAPPSVGPSSMCVPDTCTRENTRPHVHLNAQAPVRTRPRQPASTLSSSMRFPLLLPASVMYAFVSGDSKVKVFTFSVAQKPASGPSDK